MYFRKLKTTFSITQNKVYIYGEGRTTVHFLLKMTSLWSLNLSFTGFQSQPGRYTNETNALMDDAVYDKDIEWDETKLRAINACRLFHGVVYPSDMLHYNRRYINRTYLYGHKSMQNQHQQENWPEQPHDFRTGTRVA